MARCSSAIVIGQTIAASGSLAEHGRGLVLGAQAHFAMVNGAGGINGRSIELRTLDDGETARERQPTPRRWHAIPPCSSSSLEPKADPVWQASRRKRLEFGAGVTARSDSVADGAGQENF